jgi:hypothetical protein
MNHDHGEWRRRRFGNQYQYQYAAIVHVLNIMSSHEADVLERQRQMANRLAKARSLTSNANRDGTATATATAAAPTIKNKPPPPPPRPSSHHGGPQKRVQPSTKGLGSSSGGNRTLASLAGVKPLSTKTASFSRGTVIAGSDIDSGTGAGTVDDPIVFDDDKPQGKNNLDNCGNLMNQKRPSKPQQQQSLDSKTEMVLAYARQRVGIDKPKPKPSQQKRPRLRSGSINASQLSNPASIAPTAATSTSSAPTPSGSLASILLSNANTAKYLQPNAPKLLKHYDKIEPNDYWKCIKSWDFINDLNEKMGTTQNRDGGNKANGKDDTTTQGKRKLDDIGKGHAKQQPATTNSSSLKPLPDTFASYREYCALWAPLCLDEARAQILSDAIADIPYWKNNNNNANPSDKSPVRVQLEPIKADVNGSSESMGVRVKSVLTPDYKDRSFMSNDIVLLVVKESYLWEAFNGTLREQKQQQQSCTRYGLVGHIEYSRKSIEGLTIQVSRSLWSEFRSSEMVLFNLGCNITSLREFTALCRMDSIPLLDYILAGSVTQKLKSTEANGGASRSHSDGYDSSEVEKRAKKKIISSMGGAAALGKGFADYASRKFNLSQLGAISAAAQEYGDGGFTLVKGPPGTGKTTTLCALLNALHIRQMNHYFHEVKKLAESYDAVVGKRAALSLSSASQKSPRILVCAPSNAAVDNIILKIMEDGFVDGNGCRYNPSIVRVGRGQSASVKDVCLEDKVESYITNSMDVAKLESTVEGYKEECRRLHSDIAKLRHCMNAMKSAVSYPLEKDWEIRIKEDTAQVYFVNHKDKTTTFDIPPPPEIGQRHFPAEAMPEYKKFISRIVKMVERYNKFCTKIERYSLCSGVAAAMQGGANCHAMNSIRQQVETHLLDATHIVTTTLGTAGNRSLESAAKFEVVVIDECAQSVEPSTLAGLQLGSSHAILVGDPQQLPATIFNLSGRNSKYDRSLFQRLEEAGHDVHLLDTQYRMHPAISEFPRRIFYDGQLFDGDNVKHPEYGSPLKREVFRKFPAFQVSRSYYSFLFGVTFRSSLM